MVGIENRLFCRLDGLTPATREQQRLDTLTDLGLFEAEAVPVFDEAVQTAARFLEAPICILGLMTQDQQWLKSAVGLSRLGLMNQLAASRCLPRSESFCTYVVDSHQVLAISDTLRNPVFAASFLVQQYGIRSYLGVPLVTPYGQCLGTLTVMDLVPRTFTTKDIEFLELTARWSLSEFERNHLLKEQYTASQQVSKSFVGGQYRDGQVQDIPYEDVPTKSQNQTNVSSTNSLKAKLLVQLSQELRTPLTSVMGMTSVLMREVYGPITDKQKEYLEIIHDSGQHLVSLVDEILALEIWDEASQQLNAMPADIEMLCQQAMNSLSQLAKQRQQQIRLSVEPGNRIWLLDKDKVRQMLYYLVFSVIYSAEVGSVIRIHVSRKSERLNISVWTSHPWLGDGLPQIMETRDLESLHSLMATITHGSESKLDPLAIDTQELLPALSWSKDLYEVPSCSVSNILAITDGMNKTSGSNNRETLGLLLSCHLAQLSGGHVLVQGSPESGYRYVVSLPQLTEDASL